MSLGIALCCGFSQRRRDTELPQHSEHVVASEVINELSVFNPADHDALYRDALPGRSYSHQFPTMRAFASPTGDHRISFRDLLVNR